MALVGDVRTGRRAGFLAQGQLHGVAGHGSRPVKGQTDQAVIPGAQRPGRDVVAAVFGQDHRTAVRQLDRVPGLADQAQRGGVIPGHGHGHGQGRRQPSRRAKGQHGPTGHGGVGHQPHGLVGGIDLGRQLGLAHGETYGDGGGRSLDLGDDAAFVDVLPAVVVAAFHPVQERGRAAVHGGRSGHVGRLDLVAEKAGIAFERQTRDRLGEAHGIDHLARGVAFHRRHPGPARVGQVDTRVFAGHSHVRALGHERHEKLGGHGRDRRGGRFLGLGHHPDLAAGQGGQLVPGDLIGFLGHGEQPRNDNTPTGNGHGQLMGRSRLEGGRAAVDPVDAAPERTGHQLGHGRVVKTDLGRAGKALGPGPQEQTHGPVADERKPDHARTVADAGGLFQHRTAVAGIVELARGQRPKGAVQGGGRSALIGVGRQEGQQQFGSGPASDG